MICTAEINITSQEGFDLTLDCPSPGIISIKQHLKQEGFEIKNERISIEGTKNINDLIELEIEGSEFEKLQESIIEFLNSKNVRYTEERLNSTSDLHSRFNLEDISVFDKAS
jgi:tRNA A22 N-methylase